MKKRKKHKHKKLPDLSYLLDNYVYDPVTGDFFKKDCGLKSTGWTDKRGYKHVRIKKQVYKLHRIVFYMFHKRDPKNKVIDHINGDPKDNRIVNLRAVTHRQNSNNTKKKRSTTGLPKGEPGACVVFALPAGKTLIGSAA